MCVFPYAVSDDIDLMENTLNTGLETVGGECKMEISVEKAKF